MGGGTVGLKLSSGSRAAIRATPNITALVVPLVVPSGKTVEARSIRTSFFFNFSLVLRTSSISVCKAKCEFATPGMTLPATLPWWHDRQFMVHTPCSFTTYCWGLPESSPGAEVSP